MYCMNNKKDNPLVSIVVPIYNAEKILTECLDSILMQTYENIEVVLIDDGSHDKSAEICLTYQKQYGGDKVKYIYQKNSGPSVARNKGIEVSQGKYIAFVDADDTVSPAMISTMVATAEDQDAEMVICAYTLIEGDKRTDCFYSLPEGFYEGERCKEVLSSLIAESMQSVPPYSWVRLTQKRVFIESGLRFAANLIRSEDYHFWVKVHSKIRNVYLQSTTSLYNYVSNSTSITHRYIRDYWKGVVFLYEDLCNTLSDATEIKTQLDIMLVKRSLIALNNAARCNSRMQAWKAIWEVLNDKQLNLVIRSLDKTKFSRFKSFRRVILCRGHFLVAFKYMLENFKNHHSR